jgi:hypothetical protein
MRDGNGPRALDTLVRYRGSVLAELFRAFAALRLLQADARELPEADAPDTRPRSCRAPRHDQTNPRRHGKTRPWLSSRGMNRVPARPPAKIERCCRRPASAGMARALAKARPPACRRGQRGHCMLGQFAGVRRPAET